MSFFVDLTLFPAVIARPARWFTRTILHDEQWMMFSIDLAAMFPAWMVLTVIASFLRGVNLGAEKLWYDESFTAWLAKLPFDQMMVAIRGDVHPPLWYIIEWANVRILGDSELALRLPSCILGILAVLLVRRIALALKLDGTTAFVAGLLTAFLPAALYYSQEARMYALLTVFVLLMVNAALRDGVLVFVIAGIGAVYTQNLGVLYVAAIGLAWIAWCIRNHKSVLKPLSACLAVAGGWFLWLPTLLYQMHNISNGFWLQPLSLPSILTPYFEMTMGWRASDNLGITLYIAALSVTLIGVIACRKWLFSGPGLLLVAAVFGAAAIGAAVSFLWRSIYLGRAFLPATILLMIIWAYALVHLSKPNRRVAQLVLVPALLIGVVSHYYPAQGERVDIAAFVTEVTHQWQPGDIVYFISISSAISIEQYTVPRPYALMPEATDLNQSLTSETKNAMGMKQIPFTDLAGEGFKRAWLIASINPLVSQAEIDELHTITADYPARLVEQTGDEYSNSSIYLVTLK